MRGDAAFTEADRKVLAERGISEDEALRQLERMSRPPVHAQLVRPCTLGDGIERIGDSRLPALLEAHARAASAGAVSTFVPASGAATRMFHDLLSALHSGDPLDPDEVRAAAAAGVSEGTAVAALVESLPRFAFHAEVESAVAAAGHRMAPLRERGPWRPILEALLSPKALDYARLPKGLLAFHPGPKTAFGEHLEEAAALTRDAGGRCRAHFTVSPEHRSRFEAHLAALAPELHGRLGATLDVEFSEQHPSTDTLAADPAGGAFRDADGQLVFRPAGHGALLQNLEETRGDLVFVKNIDNVAVERLRPETTRWSRALVGLAADLRSRAETLRDRLAGPDGVDAGAEADARSFVREALGDPDVPGSRMDLCARLDRPLRVCGMVPNTGEPGGGPFWVRGRDGRVSRQVVEGAQVDTRSAEQAGIVARATHFNPVFFACSLRGGGRAYPLANYVDADAAIVTRKGAAGRPLLALESPGLWNGAMAEWNTVFVEVPLAVFNPVKSVLDLLRPEHQG
jgi:hypothetical protein